MHHKRRLQSVIMTENVSQQSVFILEERRTASCSPPATAHLVNSQADMWLDYNDPGLPVLLKCSSALTGPQTFCGPVISCAARVFWEERSGGESRVLIHMEISDRFSFSSFGPSVAVDFLHGLQERKRRVAFSFRGARGFRSPEHAAGA